MQLFQKNTWLIFLFDKNYSLQEAIIFKMDSWNYSFWYKDGFRVLTI